MKSQKFKHLMKLVTKTLSNMIIQILMLSPIKMWNLKNKKMYSFKK
jgi:hypothetical protein